MDGSFVENSLLVELEAIAQQTTTWTEVRIKVRAWALQHQFLACQTTPVADGVQIAYQDSTEECKTVLLKLPSDLTSQYIKEYEAMSGVW